MGIVQQEQRIGIIIPTYRRASALNKCIQSVISGSELKCTIVVVNDGSDTKVSDLLCLNYPDCIELTSNEDLWWTKSVNIGLEYLLKNGFSAAILLNDDVTVIPGFVDRMLRSHRQYPKSIVISKVVDQDGMVWSQGGYASWPFHGERHFLSHPLPSNLRREITWSPGMGTLIPLAVVEKVGFLEERFMPQYLSDADFGLRATRSGCKMDLNQECVVRNDTRTTGGVSEKSRLNFSDLHFILFNVRSPDYLKARFVFIYRHAPFGLRTISFVIRLAKIFIYFIKRFH